MVRDVATLISKSYPDRKALRAEADRVAKVYSSQVSGLKRQVDDLSDGARKRVSSLDLQSKLSLAAELWRVRASIDLLSLADPGVIKDLTGMDISGFSEVRRRFLKAEAALKG